MRRSPLAIMMLIVGLGLVFLAGPRIDLSPYKPQPITLEEDLDHFLQKSESQVPGLIQGTEKTIQWAHPDHRVTPWALVYLHGFTASRRELHPVVETVAQNLAANVFFARLEGHGIQGPDAIGAATRQGWFHDAEEALAIGRRLGERVAVIGTSTGGALAVWLAAHHSGVDTLVMISPNFGPARKSAELILLPWGPKLAEWIVGPYVSWDVPTKDIPPFFTTRYATTATFPMMAVVSAARSLEFSKLTVPTLTLYSPDDTVVDPRLIEKYVGKIASARKEVIPFPHGHHVLAGQYGQKENTATVIEKITAFLKKE